MRLNLGCGNRKLDGWVNVDKVAACNPDQIVDLEQFPWPWAYSSVSEVMLNHVLEHLGAKTETYLGIIQELYRVCQDGAILQVNVPHPRHDNFLGDPTHVRPITEDGLALLSQKNCDRWIAMGAANTPLARYLSVDFEVIEGIMIPDPHWGEQYNLGKITLEVLNDAARSFNNVISETKFKLKVLK